MAGTMTSSMSIFCAAIEIDPPKSGCLPRRGLWADWPLAPGVEKLLRDHSKRAISWSRPARGHGLRSTADEAARRRRPGTVIGPYKLLQQIGEGGMGTVYMAEQTRARAAQGRAQADQAGHGQPPGPRPLRGRAAGAGPDGSSQYRQGARRRHAPTRGRPYFVMELVKGVPITGTATSTG